MSRAALGTQQLLRKYLFNEGVKETMRGSTIRSSVRTPTQVSDQGCFLFLLRLVLASTGS